MKVNSKFQTPNSRGLSLPGEYRLGRGVFSVQCSVFSWARYLVPCKRREEGSAFIIVLWIAFGLVSLALYFGHSMVFELRAADNRTSAIVAGQAIEGAARYVSDILANQIA
ncbi:MAG TPA: hypothetical protein VLT36_15465, partial [Candidatus Dormibacteraeota bacterium]|nr:hypothetical protein [Candidatus Dormibacteraeota bacterium]